MPADVWIPSAIRIFREKGCNFGWVETHPACMNGKRHVLVDMGVVEKSMTLDDYRGLRVYFEGLCKKVKKK